MNSATVRPFALLIATIAIDTALLAGGCAKQHNAADSTRSMRGADLAPQGAQLVAVGTLPLSFVMAHPGTISIVDVTTGELKHTATITDPMSAKGLLTIDPVDRAIVVSPSGAAEDRIVLLTPIEPEHRYAIYYSPLKPVEAAQGSAAAAHSTTRPGAR